MGWTFYNSSGEQLIYDGGAATEQATQAEAEAESNVDKYIPPDLIRNSPGVGKAWCRVTTAGALQTGDYNVASFTDSGTGIGVVVWDTDFADVNYSAFTCMAANYEIVIAHNTFAVGSSQIYRTSMLTSGAYKDGATSTVAFGDQ